MERRRQSRVAEGLMDFAALLPWWAGVALALLSYRVLRGLATQPLHPAQNSQQIAEQLSAVVWQGVASVGQYILPLLCLLSALLSVLRRRQRHRERHEEGTATERAEPLQENIPWQDFELLVSETFRRRGYAVQETAHARPDGGLHLVLSRNNERTLVQCKQWNALRVGVPAVHTLYDLMLTQGAAAGIVMTSGRFTQEAHDFAQAHNIALVDGQTLVQLLSEAREPVGEEDAQALRGTASASHANPQPQAAALPLPSRPAPQWEDVPAPVCPRCGDAMVLRVARRGARAGQFFWSCSGFLRGCRGTRTIQES